MATPAPPVAGSASSRWARTTSESGSAFSGLGRGGRGGGRGRSRGGRGRGGGGAGVSRTPSSAAEKPAASESSTSTSKPASSGSGPAPTQKPQAPSGSGQAPAQKPPVTSGQAQAAPAQKPSAPAAAVPQKPTVPATTPARPKAHGRKSSRSVVPTVVVGPSTPSTETPASTSRPSNRRRRSQQLNSKGNASGLKVNVPASLDDNLLRPQNRLAVPHTAPLPSKDTPPHLAGSSFDMRNNIDALVERVRAVAMDHRPSTPGSHIDWAGDDDEGLPDLDDWGVTTSVGDAASVGDKDEMISPIIVDGLKPLPEPVAKPLTPPSDIKEEAVAPFVMEAPQNPPQPNQTPLHPSLPPKPITGPIITTPHSGRGNNNRKSPVKVIPVEQVPAAPQNSESTQPSVDGTKLDPRPKEKQDDVSSDSGREGLAASIHAPSHSDSFAPSNSSTPPPQPPRNFSPTHNRAQTVGRIFPQSAPVNFNSRFSRSGTSTPRGGHMGGGQHARTHSSPPAGSMLNNHRPPHSRPVITGDAISRLARTIASTPRTPPIPASNI